jgi:hypothetical protein
LAVLPVYKSYKTCYNINVRKTWRLIMETVFAVVYTVCCKSDIGESSASSGCWGVYRDRPSAELAMIEAQNKLRDDALAWEDDPTENLRVIETMETGVLDEDSAYIEYETDCADYIEVIVNIFETTLH